MSIDAAWVALSLVNRIGYKTLRSLWQEFGTTQAILQADVAALKRVKGVGEKTARAIRAIDLAQVEEAICDWQDSGVGIIPFGADDYPASLSKLPDAPPTLFVRGLYEPMAWEKTVAIVGTRGPSPQGHAIALSLGAELVYKGYAVVSGLALGIDSEAHRGALSNQYGRTIAVTGSGVLNVYPAQNQHLAQRILQQGCLMSENHPFAEATAPRLVSRNRLITGLAQHVIVVETAANGGAMYAARFAREQGRNVYAVDLPASGNQQLLSEGAISINPTLTQLSTFDM